MNYIVMVELKNRDDDHNDLVIGPFRTLAKAQGVVDSLEHTAAVELGRLSEDDRTNPSVGAWVQRFRSVADARSALREFVQSFDGGPDVDD